MFDSYKLLAFRPFILSMSLDKVEKFARSEKKRPEIDIISPLSGFIWPIRRVITTPHCPNESNTYGIYSTVDYGFAKNTVIGDCIVENGLYVLGVIQVLGHTVVSEKQLRSERAVLWGLVKPKKIEEDIWATIGTLLYRTHRPVIYFNLSQAFRDANYTWNYFFAEKSND